MDRTDFDTRFNALVRNDKWLKKLLFISILTTLLLTILLLKNVNKERVVMIPQVAPENKLWISQSDVSNEYLTILTRNIMDLVLNITPDTVISEHHEVLKFVTPSAYAELKTKLNDISKIITNNDISQNFFIHDIRIMHSKKIVFVSGSLVEYIDKTLSNTTQQIYKLTYQSKNYGVKLTGLELLTPNDPQLKDVF